MDFEKDGAMNPEWSDDELQFLRDVTDVPGAAVEALHTRVMEHIPRRRRFGWPSAAGVAAALLAGVFWWTRPVEVANSRPLAAVVPRPVEVAAPVLSPKPVARPRVRRMPRPEKTVPGAAVIRIETEDPEVVLYLIADGGDE
ncbi:MAG: hypothetical protein R2729_02605 [Bryobacteraceae bacterium]